MKKLLPSLSAVCLIMLCHLTGSAQTNPTFTSITGHLVRVTPKLADLDKYPTGLVLQQTRDEDGLIGVDDDNIIIRPNHFGAEEYGPDKALQPPSSNMVTAATATIGANFTGLGYTSVNPSDPNCAVGPNHVIQTINNSTSSYFKIWDKTGTVVQAQTLISSLTGVQGNGDPVVLYDQLANRWVLTEFGKTPSSQTFINTLVMAVSVSDDPTGSWYVYSFVDNTFFVDYPKFSVWHNAYYATSNDFNTAGNTYFGSSIYAFDRTKMLAGDVSATAVRSRMIDAGGRYFSMGPVCLEGTTPSSQSGLFTFFQDSQFTTDPTDVDSIFIFEFTPNFVTPASSTISAFTKLVPTDFDSQVCTATRGQCISQQGSAIAVEDLAGRIMHKITYRNFGTYEAMVFNTTVDASGTGRAGIRWWELRRPAATWSIYQEGTYSPDANNRWLGGICMDAIGNIGLMYNVSGATAFPSIRFTARNPCDPLGTMTLPEQVIIAGAFANGSTRYGDYNTLCVDPSTGRDFWLTAQHNAAATTWGTQVATFKLNNCSATPKIRFENASLALREADANVVSGCQKYKDYTVNVVIDAAPSANATVTFNTSGTATNGLDYTISPASVVLSSGTLTQPLTIRVFDDAAVEGNESFTISYTLNNGGGNAATDTYNQTCLVNIVDNDAGPILPYALTQPVGTLTYDLVQAAGDPLFNSKLQSKKVQLLYKASELTAAGLTAGSITSMSFYIYQKNSTRAFSNLTIKMIGTPPATTPNLVVSGVYTPISPTIVKNPFTYSTVAGYNDFVFDVPFSWNGTDNIVVEVCYDNGSTAASQTSDHSGGYTDGSASTIGNMIWQDAINCSGSFSAFLSFTSGVKAMTKFAETVPGTSIAASTTSSKTAYLGPNQDVYFYDASGNIMARIKNLTSFDYGCTQVLIDRQGSSAVQFWNAVPSNYLTSKSFKVIPTNNTSTGSYQLTLYYNNAEVSGFNTAASPSTFATSQIVKVSNGFYIPDVTPASTHFADSYVTGASVAAFGTSGNTATATFSNTGFSGFAVGSPGNSLLTADYRSKSSGNYSDVTKWEYNIFGANYIDANQAPTSGSNVNIQAGHTITLDASQTIGNTKSLTVNGVLDAGTNTVNGPGSFTLAAGGTLATANTGTNGITQNITVSGTRIFFDAANYIFNGATTAPFGAAFTTVKPNNVTVGANITLDKTTYISGALGFTGSNRTLTTGSNLTIGSSASGTARIADLTKDFVSNAAVSGNSISGNAIIERYIANAGHRAWHLLSGKAVTGSQTIFQAWQENGATGIALPNYGTWVTSNSYTGSNGFDATSLSASVLTHNQGGVSGPSWNYNLANTNSTVLSANQGYMLFVRGDRNYTPTLPSPTATLATTLRTTGAVTQGTQAGITVSATGTGRTLIGNPFASAIDMDAIFTGTANLNQDMYIWDPTMTGNFGVGGFRVVQRVGANNYQATPSISVGSDNTLRYIQSGEAFFLKATGTNASVVVSEALKTASTAAVNPIINTAGDQQIIANLFIVNPGNDASLADGIRVRYDDAYRADITDDIEKIGNFAENIASFREGKKLIVEKRPMIGRSDTIFLRITNTGIKDYRLRLGTIDFVQTDLKAYLQDAWLGTNTPVDLSGSITDIDFKVTADAASAAADRFRIVFKTNAIDPQRVVQPAGITVYPSPLNGGKMILQFSDMEKGMYSLRLISESGAVVYSGQLTHPGGSASQTIEFKNRYANGSYRLEIIKPDRSREVKAVVISN